jgi:hypothetical protein
MAGYPRPGVMYYTTNGTGGTIAHRAPCISDDGNVVGIAIKQKSVGWAEGLAAHSVIPDGEDFVMVTKGIVEVDTEAGFDKGNAIYIADASTTNGVTTFDLTETGTDTPFGRVVEVVGDGRGVPTGKVRIDLDKKDSV